MRIPFPSLLAMSGCLILAAATPERTVSSFEASAFAKAMGKAKKDSWALKTGGTSHSYSFMDPEKKDPFPSLSVDLTVAGGLVKSVAITWSPYDAKVRMTPRKEGQITQLLQWWGTPELSEEVIAYARENHRKNYPNSVGASPKARIGSLLMQCGQTAGDVCLIWSSPAPGSVSTKGDAKPAVSGELKLTRGTIREGMTSDQFVAIVRKTEITSQDVQQDPNVAGSLLVKKTCSVEGRTFTATFGRKAMPGPYVLLKLSL